MTPDPRELLSRSKMSMLQVIAVAITIGLNALDGFDVLAISFAAPGIAEEWGINRAELGIVLSMELVGMAIGSIALGGLADRIGRRPTILACLVVMTGGMLMVPSATGMLELSVWRVLTGLGIGGMLAAINAAAAEFSNSKRRDLNVSLMAIGYPVGAVLGGLVVAQLLKFYEWRSIFYFGGLVTALFIPLVLLFVPESVHWLSQKQPKGALDKINRTLTRMGHPTITALPVVTETQRKQSATGIFTRGLILTTILVTLAYFLHITTFYFILKWVPKIVVDMGFAASSAAGVLTWANVGGATGGAVLGLLAQRYNVKALTIGVLIISTVMVTVFGHVEADLAQISLICACAGFFTNAGVVGLYAILARAFPTHVRGSGTGFAIGTGRGGSVLAPMLGGFLFAAGFELPSVAFIISAGSLIAAAALFFLKLSPDIDGGTSTANAATDPAVTPAPATR